MVTLLSVILLVVVEWSRLPATIVVSLLLLVECSEFVSSSRIKVDGIYCFAAFVTKDLSL